MKTLAVVSSWNEPCGIATYAECLIPEFKKYYKTDILPLNTEILQSTNKNFNKMGDKLIEEISEKVKKYDYVNIQFEVGLFGVNKTQVYNRLMKIVKASKNLIITFHSINLSGSELNLRAYIGKNPVKVMIDHKKENYWPEFYLHIFRELKKLSKHRSVNVIVHNKRDCNAIKKITGFGNVYDYPLGMYNEKIRSRVKTREKKEQFLKKYNLDAEDKVLGVFGFVSLYKGHETVIRALPYLPDNYKMLVFGGQHIRGIRPFVPIDEYLKKLLELIMEKDKEIAKENKERDLLHERIKFVGGVSDEDFIEAMMFSDFVILPYIEVNQMASGVATTALELCSRLIMSNTNCFNELSKYYPNCFKKFDIGNYLELSYDILNWQHDYEDNIRKCLEVYNLENNVKNYVNIFEGNCDER